MGENTLVRTRDAKNKNRNRVSSFGTEDQDHQVRIPGLKFCVKRFHPPDKVVAASSNWVIDSCFVFSPLFDVNSATVMCRSNSTKQMKTLMMFASATSGSPNNVPVVRLFQRVRVAHKSQHKGSSQSGNSQLWIFSSHAVSFNFEFSSPMGDYLAGIRGTGHASH